MNFGIHRIQESENKLGGNKVVTTKNEVCPMTISKTVTANIICMKKLVPNPCQLQGEKSKPALISATISINGLRAKLSALEGTVGSDREATRGHGTRVSALPCMTFSRPFPHCSGTSNLGDGHDGHALPPISAQAFSLLPLPPRSSHSPDPSPAPGNRPLRTKELSEALPHTEAQLHQDHRCLAWHWR